MRARESILRNAPQAIAMERRDNPGGAGLFMVDLSPQEDKEALFVVVFESPEARALLSRVLSAARVDLSLAAPDRARSERNQPCAAPLRAPGRSYLSCLPLSRSCAPQDAQRFMWLWCYQSSRDDEGLAMMFNALPSLARNIAHTALASLSFFSLSCFPAGIELCAVRGSASCRSWRRCWSRRRRFGSPRSERGSWT